MARFASRFASGLALLLFAALLSACGGGGGSSGAGSGDNGGGPDVPEPPPCVETQMFGCLEPAEFEVEADKLAETFSAADSFDNQWGLASVGTDRAWAHLELQFGPDTSPGDGQTVGVIDSGIDNAHPVFAGKLVSEEFFFGATNETGATRSHGTAVAAVIAARPDADFVEQVRGTAGVAPGADIAMFALPTGSGSGVYTPISLTGLASSDSDWKTLADRVVSWSSGERRLDFVNLSLGYPGMIEQYDADGLRDSLSTSLAAMAQAGATRKTVFVWAAGNAHGAPCNQADFPGHTDLCEAWDDNGVTRYRVNAKSVQILPGLPLRIPELRDVFIAAVAIGEDGEIADFSNRCGVAADWCVAAPGVDVRTAYFGPHPDTGADGARGAFDASGTSFAAPMVTGALVVMKHYFRDQLSNTALVARLLETADREGIYADSAIYGRGLLDIDAATSPAGVASLALGTAVGGPGRPAAQSVLALGSALGDGPAAALAGQEIVAFDELGAPFWYGLGGFVRAAPRMAATARLARFMAPEAPDAWATPQAGRAGVEGRGEGRREVRTPLLGGFAPAGPVDPRGPLDLRGPQGSDGLRFGLVAAPAAGPGGGHLALAAGAPAFDAALSGPAGLGFAIFSTEGIRGRAPVSGALLDWQPQGRPFGVPLRLRAGWLAERMTMLGGRADGAFGRLAAGSAFAGFEGGVRAGAWQLTAGLELGMAWAGAQDGLIERLSPVSSSAFALQAERPVGADAALRFTASQPLRVESGRLRLSVPVGRTPEGAVLRRTLAVGAAPTGRQIDLGARWSKRLASGDIRLGATWTFDPGHNAAAPSELTLMAGWRRSF